MTQTSDDFFLGRFRPPWQIPHEYLKGSGNLSGNIISIKRNHQSNLVSFFLSNSDFPTYVATFSGQLYFGKSYFFTLFQSNYVDTTVTFSGQIFLQNSCCFLLFQNSHFFAGVIFSKQLSFSERNFVQSRRFLRIRSSRTAFLSGETVQDKDI